jgi:hypothetical protein
VTKAVGMGVVVVIAVIVIAMAVIAVTLIAVIMIAVIVFAMALLWAAVLALSFVVVVCMFHKYVFTCSHLLPGRMRRSPCNP